MDTSYDNAVLPIVPITWVMNESTLKCNHFK